MIQLWWIILDFGSSADWSIILTMHDIEFIWIVSLLSLILFHIKKIEKNV